MFKFKGISSEDMQVVIEEEENFIARASKRYEITEIEGKDGAIFDELGYSVVERPMYVQCLNINKIDDILAWLDGEGEFEYKGRKTTARFYSQLDPQRSSCIRIMDTTFIRDPFWYKANEDFQLVKDRKDKKASGEYIHVEDSSNCRAKIGIGGNSEQETREGYNLLNFKKWKDNNVSWNLGKNIVYGDNYVSGTSEGTDCYSNTVNEQYRFNCEPNTTYTLFYINDNSIMCRPIAFVYDSESKNIQTLELGLSADNIIIRRFTTSSEAGKMAIRLGTNVDGVNFKFSNIMILKGIYDKSTIPNYEQYGAMPSPDYPSEIKTVGSNINLIEETFEGYNINGNGAFEKANGFDMQIAKLKANVKYTLNSNTYVFGYYNEKPTIASITYDKSRVVLPQSLNTITPTRDGYISFRTDKTDNNKKIKLVEGTEVGEYSKYGQGCVKVTKCNKNLFGKYVTGIWLDTSKKLYLASSTAVGFIARVKPNTTYTIKKKNKGNRFLLTAGKEPVKIGNAFSRLIFASNHDLTQYTFTTKENEYYIFLGVYIGTDENELVLAVEKTQLECGNKATTCEEHKEQSYIMPVQQEMLEGDYFDFDNEEEVHTWNKLVLNGTESIEKFQYSDNTFLIAKGAKNVNASEILVKSNMFMGVSYNNRTISRNYIIYVEIETGNIIFRNTSYSALADFKTWLKSQYDAGTPVVIYYKLATPTRLPFTDEQKAVAKELNNARTYKNVTNIYSTDETSPIIDLDYFIVTNETIKNEGNIQSRPILRLEKTVSEAVEITINDVRFKYSFSGDKYVDIDCENKTVEYEQLNRNRNLSIGYDFPKLNIGNNKIIMNDGDCILKVIRKDRWL